MGASWKSSAGILLSFALHAALFVGLGVVRIDSTPRRAQPVEFSVVETRIEPPAAVAPEPEPPPTPQAPPPPPKPVRAEPKPLPRAAERAPQPVEAPPPPQPDKPAAAAQEEIADFSGTTLTNEGEGGWVSAVGNDGAMNGPIGRPGGVVTGRKVEGVQGGVVGGTGTRLVGEADLSRKPKLPSQDVLNQALERNYPKSAKQQGIEGSAKIKMRVLANGKLEPIRKDGESYPGFGEACLKAMKEVAQQYRADPPIDRQGQPAATEITFNCTFTVD